MAAARKARDEDGSALSMNFASHPPIEQRDGVNSVNVPSSTPSYNRHLTPALTPNSSAAWVAASYLYLNLLVFDGEWRPGGYANPLILQWLLDWIQVQLTEEYDIATQSYSGELWLWRVAVGAYALTVVGSSPDVGSMDGGDGRNEGEGRREMGNIVKWYASQLSKRQQATWNPNWMDAKEVLDMVHWLQTPGSNGESVLEQALQDAIRHKSTQQ